MRVLQKFIVVAAAVLAAACQTVQTTQPGAIGVDRKQQMLVSEAEVEKGADRYAFALAHTGGR